jgi:hypothetical protein
MCLDAQRLLACRRLRIVHPVREVSSRLTKTTSRGKSPARTFSVIVIFRPRPPAK